MKGQFVFRWLVFGLVLLLVWPMTGFTATTLPPSLEVSALDRFFADYVQERQLPGLSVTLVHEGKVILSKGYGSRSRKPATPVTPDTPFAIGSVSKQFTCAAVLLLAEEGKLSVRDPVEKYYPHLTEARSITLLDLMNHVSGYPDYYPLDFVDRRMKVPIDPDELLRQYAGGPLDFPPGSRFSYSNTGYILLGRVVEKVSGQPLGEFLQRRIFEPLGMTHTRYEPAPEPDRFAQGFTTLMLSDPEPVEPEAKGWLGAAGGIYSTTPDLARWNLALLEGRVLKPESFALMTQARVLQSGKISDYGCGVGVSVREGRRVISHSGAVSGFATTSYLVPSTRSSLTFCANLDGGLAGMPSQVLTLMLKEPAATVPVITGPSAEDVTQSLFRALQQGEVDRRQLGGEFSFYLTPERLTAAAQRLRPLGSPTRIEMLSSSERGGMEVTSARLHFAQSTVKTLMYRKPDGTVEQFFVDRD